MKIGKATVLASFAALAVLLCPRFSGAAEGDKSYPGDRAFLSEAARRGRMEVDIGGLATRNAASDPVKQFGQRMMDDYSKANAELTKVARQLKIELANPIDDYEAKGVSQRLSALKGKEFDKAYMGDMLKDHEQDVKSFEAASEQATDAEVKAFAAKTLPTLKEHLQIAKKIAGQVGVSPGGDDKVTDDKNSDAEGTNLPSDGPTGTE